MSSEQRARLEAVKSEYDRLREALQVEPKLKGLTSLEARMASVGFWDNPEAAQQVVQDMKDLRAATAPFVEVGAMARDLNELITLAEMEEDDDAILASLNADLDELEARMEKLQLRALYSGENDSRPCFLSIQAGAGGTESCDWAGMLLRMYARWIERAGLRAECIEHNEADEAGIKSATLLVKGDTAYGRLRPERGVHRLVRISPFDAQSRRHTSFAAVDVMPEFDEIPDIEINDGDLRVDTFRASGAGGQHVNKTDSAIRLTHLPTGIAVSCQNERSQHANRRTAMSILTSRLYQLEQEKREAKLQALYGDRGEIAWGNQIRSYVLQPYQMVKDHRTNWETANTGAVLDGDLDAFMEAYLRQEAEEQARAAATN